MSGRSKRTFGTIDKQVIDPSIVWADTRSTKQKIFDWLVVPDNMFVLLFINSGVAWYYPKIAVLILLFSVLLFFWGLARPEQVPLKLPIQSGYVDLKESSNSQTKKADGIFFLGQQKMTGKEVWLTNSDCRQHFLVLGTTGAGKALSLETEIHTPGGIKLLRDLSVGDYVTTPDGGHSKIIGYFHQGYLPMCRLVFEDGREAKACPDHLWEVFELNNKNDKSFKTKHVLDTKSLIEEMNTNVSRCFYIRTPSPVEKNQIPLGLSSFYIGKIFAEFDSKVSCHSEDDFISSMLNFNSDLSFVEKIRDGDIYQREKFLRGFSSVSGEFDEDSAILTFNTNYAESAKIIQKIIWSLGGLAYICSKKIDKKNIHYSVVASSFDMRIILQKPNAPQKCNGFVRLVKIENLENKENAACILIDHPDHLFVISDYVTTHNTEVLLGFGANALTWGSGFLFCDGKGEISVFLKFFSLVRRFGREDDLLVLNFIPSGRIEKGVVCIKSNTLNPFATGSSDELTQMMASLMDNAGGDTAMWKNRAIAMLTGIIRALCWARDEGLVDLNIAVIDDYMRLDKIIELAKGEKYPDMPEDIKVSLNSYLHSLPGYQPEKGEKQSTGTLEQHGFLQMQFTKTTSGLRDVYGHIFKTPYGEVDMYDVIMGRRILFIMLPTLKTSSEELANLGKIVIANLRGIMGATLGDKLEMDYKYAKIRPTDSNSPFICILDEVGYYTVDGMASMSAQARSLGFSMVYASQDIPAMKRLNDKEADSIVANSAIKIFMRIEDPGQTAKLAIDRADRAVRARVSGFRKQNSELSGGMVKSDDVNFEEVERVKMIDLADQDSGEMHITFKGEVIRANALFVNAEETLEKSAFNRLHLNHFVKVARPRPEDVNTSTESASIKKFLLDNNTPNIIKSMATKNMQIASNDEIHLLSVGFENVLKTEGSDLLTASFGAVSLVVKNINEKNASFSNDIQAGIKQQFETNDHNEDDDVVDDSAIEDDSPEFPSRPEYLNDIVDGNIPNSGIDIDKLLHRQYYEKMADGRQNYHRHFNVADPNIDVHHGMTVSGQPPIDMVAELGDNDALMTALGSLNLKGDKDEEKIATKFDKIVGTRANGEQFSGFKSAAEDLDRSMSPIVSHIKPHEDSPSDIDKSSFTSGAHNEVIGDFFEALLSMSQGSDSLSDDE